MTTSCAARLVTVVVERIRTAGPLLDAVLTRGGIVWRLVHRVYPDRLPKLERLERVRELVEQGYTWKTAALKTGYGSRSGAWLAAHRHTSPPADPE
jgi:hypothetical protein